MSGTLCIPGMGRNDDCICRTQRVENLAGTGDRPVYADADGDLVIAPASGGVDVPGVSAALEGFAEIHKTILSLTIDGIMDLVDGSDNGNGVKIFTFPPGVIYHIGSTIDATVVHNNGFNAHPADSFVVGVGTIKASPVLGTLSGHQVDIIASTLLDTVSNTVLLHNWHNYFETDVWDGASGPPVDVYVNAAVLDANTNAGISIGISGTLTITWVNLGDY